MTSSDSSPYQHLFGPVPSRRFGRSLGVDMVPFKTCTMDCLFCEVGPTTARTIERREYVPTAEILDELRRWCESGAEADFVTLAGSGEPTLHTGFGQVLDFVRASGKARSALLTNSTLLSLSEVRRDASRADVVKATLSAWDQASLEALHRPHPSIQFQNMLEGLRRFRAEFRGELRLEVFLVRGVNDDPYKLRKLADLAVTIKPDRIQLNTAFRPTAHPNVAALSEEAMNALANLFTPRAEVPAVFTSATGRTDRMTRDSVLAMLKRRPCSAQDLLSLTGLEPAELAGVLAALEQAGLVRSESGGHAPFYSATPACATADEQHRRNNNQ